MGEYRKNSILKPVNFEWRSRICVFPPIRVECNFSECKDNEHMCVKRRKMFSWHRQRIYIVNHFLCFRNILRPSKWKFFVTQSINNITHSHPSTNHGKGLTSNFTWSACRRCFSITLDFFNQIDYSHGIFFCQFHSSFSQRQNMNVERCRKKTSKKFC